MGKRWLEGYEGGKGWFKGNEGVVGKWGKGWLVG